MKTIFQTSAGGIVYKKVNNELFWLVCQHSQHKGWVFPKGLVGDHTPNEPMDQAALREVEEEGGINAKIINKKPIKTFYQYVWQGDLIKKTVYYFLMEYISGDPKNHDWEMDDAKFLKTDEVKKILTYPSDKQVFEKILKMI
ncbi:MAG: NUDIX hydrolase [Candidatus Microgenomates bacterium]